MCTPVSHPRTPTLRFPCRLFNETTEGAGEKDVEERWVPWGGLLGPVSLSRLCHGQQMPLVRS